ncbi:MAG: GyrI-like domain-containing protein [Chloroflexota bacterium]|nr:GyrI-like domain-containing protein [Chloroflexota bacterium]
MEKIDLKKELKHLYNASVKEVGLVDVPAMNFLLIDGAGDPNTAQEYKDAIEALYGLAYTLKFRLKKGELARDYGVPPLEGLWWTEDMANFSAEDKAAWKWTMLIMQPEFVTLEHVNEARAELEKKKNPVALPKIRFEAFEEGLSAQIMHLGPYAAEAPTIEKLHHFIQTNGYRLSGKHHEIYLSDPRKAAPEKMKTIIRQPIEKVES